MRRKRFGEGARGIPLGGRLALGVGAAQRPACKGTRTTQRGGGRRHIGRCARRPGGRELVGTEEKGGGMAEELAMCGIIALLLDMSQLDLLNLDALRLRYCMRSILLFRTWTVLHAMMLLRNAIRLALR